MIRNVKQLEFGYRVTYDDGTIKSIPDDSANRDYRKLLEWINTPGNEVEPEFTLAELKSRQIATLTAACASAITSGYPSSALGVEHIYPSDPIDQMNMQASIIDSLLPHDENWTTPFTCIEPAHKDDAEWPLRDHTAAQIQQAGQDGKAYILAQRIRLRAVIAQVVAAQSPEDIEAVVW